jgi:hypothetical protein
MPVEEFEKFKKSWLEEIAKIENRAIDTQGVYRIYNHFRLDVLYVKIDMTEKEFNKQFNEMNILDSKLRVALETARSRYNLENHGLWARIAEGIGGAIYRIPKNLPVK